VTGSWGYDAVMFYRVLVRLQLRGSARFGKECCAVRKVVGQSVVGRCRFYIIRDKSRSNLSLTTYEKEPTPTWKLGVELGKTRPPIRGRRSGPAGSHSRSLPADCRVLWTRPSPCGPK
jgi:hypothetical protein